MRRTSVASLRSPRPSAAARPAAVGGRAAGRRARRARASRRRGPRVSTRAASQPGGQCAVTIRPSTPSGRACGRQLDQPGGVPVRDRALVDDAVQQQRPERVVGARHGERTRRGGGPPAGHARRRCAAWAAASSPRSGPTARTRPTTRSRARRSGRSRRRGRRSRGARPPPTPGTCRNPAGARTASSRGRSAGATSRSTSPVGSASLASPRSRHHATPASSSAANALSSAGWTVCTAVRPHRTIPAQRADRGAGAPVPPPADR